MTVKLYDIFVELICQHTCTKIGTEKTQ